MSLLKIYTWKRTRSKYIFYILFWTQWINLVYLSDSTLLSNQILIKRTSYMLSQWPKKLITFIEEETEAFFSQNLAITENSLLFWLKIFFLYCELANSASSFKSSQAKSSQQSGLENDKMCFSKRVTEFNGPCSGKTNSIILNWPGGIWKDWRN